MEWADRLGALRLAPDPLLLLIRVLALLGYLIKHAVKVRVGSGEGRITEDGEWKTAATRGETLSALVRQALAEYLARAESEADDAQFAVAVLSRIAEGAPTYSHNEVWAERSRREAAGELPA